MCFCKCFNYDIIKLMDFPPPTQRRVQSFQDYTPVNPAFVDAFPIGKSKFPLLYHVSLPEGILQFFHVWCIFLKAEFRGVSSMIQDPSNQVFELGSVL